jgi:enoyl-CoA hydratase
VIPSDGGTQRLPRLVGQGRALEIILTSRVVGAQEALEIGMVHQVCDADPFKDAYCIAKKIAAHGPRAAQYLKEAVYTGSDMTLRQGMSLEADMSVILQSTLDRTEGINSFLERRAPNFKGD